MAANAPRGTIINISSGYEVRDTVGNPICSGWLVPQIEDAVRTAHNAGMIVVVSAGNDGCDAANYTPTRIPEAFVVGATDNYLLPAGRDVRAMFNQGASRFGANISAFSPGANVAVMDRNGALEFSFGTSFSAPYISGIFAAACQIGGNYCDTMPTATSVYNLMRSIGTMGTVVDPNGMPPPGGTPQRFITRGVW
jgi:subtilisin family serine protease